MSTYSHEPRAEDYAGDNNPYRGIQNHGVDPSTPPSEVPGWDGAALVPVEPDEPPQEPVPVRIVQESAHEIDMWNGTTFFLNKGNEPTLVAGRHEHRTSLNITNEGPDPVFLHPDNNGTVALAAVRIISGGSFSLDNGAEVYAFVDGATTALVRVVWEYTVEG